MKKTKARIFFIFLAGIVLSFLIVISLNNPSNHSLISLEDDLGKKIEEQLKNFDFSNINDLISNLFNNSEDNFFGNLSFAEKVELLLKGEYDFSFSTILNIIFNGLLYTIKQSLPIFCTVGAIAILGNILSNIKNDQNESIKNLINIIIYSLIAIITISFVIKIGDITIQTINSVKSVFDIIFPILLTLMLTVGSTVSIGLYKPILAILSEGIILISTNILIPIFKFSLIFAVVGNLSSNVKLSKFSKFFSTFFNYIVGFSFTAFTSLIAIFGVHAGTFDGLSVRTAKYAIKSYIPIVGGYLSDGINLILAGSVLIKNSVGLAGLLLLISIVITPIISVIIFRLCLDLLSSILEPIVDKSISNLISDISKNLTMLLAILVSMSFMYIIITSLIICSSNVF